MQGTTVVSSIINGSEFRISSRYTLLKQVGSGAYGIVASAEDSRTGGRVAVKKVGHAYADLIDAKRVVREIKLLRALGAHENIVALEDLSDDGEDVYIMTRLADTDLHRILYSKQRLT
jgi:mitogen-activated protein kinase 1/3